MGKILTGRMVKCNSGITATETTIGWYVNGEIPVAKHRTLATRTIAMMANNQEVHSLWDLDALGIKDSADKKTQDEHDQMVKEDFQSKLTRSSEGRYMVNFPWIADSIPLPNNREIAKKTFGTNHGKIEGQEPISNIR